MTDVVFVFEVHQPYRLRRDLFWENHIFERVSKEELFHYYFDHIVGEEVFKRICRKCYFPSNEILLDLIDQHKGEKKQVKLSFSISGIFLEQCERFAKDLLESFRQLAETGRVEFLGQTYYHSLASLYPDREEFIEQIKMHDQAMKDLLNCTPKVFENTELLYNNAIARTIEKLGYEGIFTEGIERILDGRSPNYVYTCKNCEKIRILMRNYKLTDDIGFRFSARWWSEWPLTADKYASWLAATPGHCISIFPDYETFGEHHWPETGIHEFLEHLPSKILEWSNLHMATPSEVLEKYSPVGEIDVHELGGTVSWADLERDTSCWLGNTMQWAYYTSVRRLEAIVKETGDEEFLRIWRYFQTSDHLYYMFTSGGGPGAVHSYFSHFQFPGDAYVTAQSAILDFENRIRMASIAADDPFLFYTSSGERNFTGIMTWTLKGFVKVLQDVELKSIEFHNRHRHFEQWTAASLRDDKLAMELKKIRLSKLEGEKLREALMKACKERYEKLKQKIQATKYI